jgi:hypothetical protein
LKTDVGVEGVDFFQKRVEGYDLPMIRIEGFLPASPEVSSFFRFVDTNRKRVSSVILPQMKNGPFLTVR